VFENLFHLSVSTHDAICWDDLRILLEKSPNLKTLTIEVTKNPKSSLDKQKN